MFEAKEKTGESFGKSNSSNMRNFSNVQIGASDQIRELYEKKAHDKMISPNSAGMQFPQAESYTIEINPLMKT